MAKRAAEEQLTDKTSMDASEGFGANTWGSGGSQRATAAQMAQRRLAKPRGTRRPQGQLGRPAASFPDASQQPSPAFGQTNGAPGGALSFGQNSSMQSFGGGGISNDSGGMNGMSENNGVSNPFTSNSFNFSAPSAIPNNPFAMNSSTESNSSFQGSIFSFGGQNSNQTNGFPPASQTSSSSIFSNAPATPSTTFGSTQAFDQASTSNIFAKPNATNSLFSNTTPQPPQPSPFNFGQKPEPTPQQSTTASTSNFGKPADKTSNDNPFGSATPSQEPQPQNLFANKENNQVDSSKTANIFGKPASPAKEPNQNLFGATSTTSQTQNASPFKNLFGQASPQKPADTPAQAEKPKPSASLFGFPTATVGNKSPERFTDNNDQMHTSPDASLQKAPRASAPLSPTKSNGPQNASANLFDRISKPDTPKESPPAASPQQGFSFASSATPAASQSRKSPTKEPSGPFASIKMPATANNVFGPPSFTKPNSQKPVSDSSDSTAPPQAPSYFSTDEKRQCIVAWRLRQLDDGMNAYLKSRPANMESVKRFYDQKKQAIIAAGDRPVETLAGSKRNRDQEQETSPTKRTRLNQGGNASPSKSVNGVFGSSAPDAEPPSAKRARPSGDVAESTSPAKPLFGTSQPPQSDAAKSQTSNLFSSILGQNHTSTPSASTATSSTGVKPPNFGTGPTNFMAQFGAAAKKTEEEARQKRKDEDYDSEEEDEATWEKRDAEEQEKKRKQIAEEAKNAPAFKFQQAAASTTSKSVFDRPHDSGKEAPNLFGHLSANQSQAADEDDEGSKSDEESAPKPVGGSLFDRISKSSSLEAAASGDHTWKVDSPIKFGSSSTAPTSQSSVTEDASTTPKAPFGGLFGAPKAQAAPITGTGGGSVNLFAHLQQPSGNSSVSFGFKPLSAAAPSFGGASDSASRASTPGLTNTGESGTESQTEQDEEHGKDAQLDLSSSREGEENEDAVFEVRSKALRMDKATKEYVSQGVGKLRVLKHKETGAGRVVLRADPSSNIILNSSIAKTSKIDLQGNAVRLLLSDSKGTPGICQLKVKTAADAKTLQEKLVAVQKAGKT